MAQLKQERAEQTRRTLLLAAAEVFDESGYAGASITRILKRAGVTAGALYFHFGSKEDLAKAVMIEQGAYLELPGGPDGLQRLVHITLYLARQLQVDPLLRGGVRLAVEQGEFGLQDDKAYQGWIQVFDEQLLAARSNGELALDALVDEVSWLLVGSFTGMQLFSQITTHRADLPARIRMLWRYLLPSVATPQARRSIVIDDAPPAKQSA
ncbi:ScbR family autoregulator-binding transcription factor [Streptomyces sp. NPDC048442]|uniref:ScbR family autoregulator-binding transcription factor n=1 Tax=Streptomyces sp. NPDC048442 TaxID=3154823 RepID=UPI003449E4B5